MTFDLFDLLLALLMGALAGVLFAGWLDARVDRDSRRRMKSREERL
jgi:hypothetical protein